MKPKLHKSLYLNIFLFLSFSLFSFSQSYIVNDDFEGNPLNTLPDGWVIRYEGTGNTDQKVVESPVKNGIQSFQVSGSGWAANLSKSVATIPTEVIFEGWVYAENTASGGRCGLGIGNPSIGSWGAFIARVEFYNGNIITYNYTGNSGGYGTQYVLQAASSNNWYHFKIETNTEAGSYKVFINNIQASSNTTGSTITEFPLLTTVTPTSIEVYGNSMVYFDDIKLYTTSNLIAFYPFNGNANDESGNNHHGTVLGPTLTMDRFGNENSAYYFNGANNNIDIGDWENGGPMSFNLWVRWDSFTNWGLIMDLALGRNNNNIYIGNQSTNNIFMFHTLDGSTKYLFYCNDTVTYPNSPLALNSWTMITCTVDETGLMKAYKNGYLIGSFNGFTPTKMIRTEQYLGSQNYPENGYFNGALDDVRIYSSVLTNAEILNLYNFNSLKIEKIDNVTENTFYVSNNLLYFKNSQNLNEIKTIEVYNLLGQKVFKTSTIEKEISLEQLKKGVYILKVKRISNDLKTLKILIN